MAHDSGKVQVYERVDGFLAWRKRSAAGDIVASDGTRHSFLAKALLAAQEANPGVDRIEVILTDNGNAEYTVPLGPNEER